MPTQAVPVIDVLLKGQNLRCGDRLLPLNLPQQSIRRGAAGAAFGGKEFHQHRFAICSAASRVICSKRMRNPVQSETGGQGPGQEQQGRQQNARPRCTQEEHGVWMSMVCDKCQRKCVKQSRG